MTPEERRWFEQVADLVAVMDLNPDERDEAIVQLPDRELVFLWGLCGIAGPTVAEGIRTGTVQTDPPGGQIVLTAKSLAELGKVREVAECELRRRVTRDDGEPL